MSFNSFCKEVLKPVLTEVAIDYNCRLIIEKLKKKNNN